MAGKREGSPTVGGATGNEKKKQRIDSFQYDQSPSNGAEVVNADASQRDDNSPLTAQSCLSYKLDVFYTRPLPADPAKGVFSACLTAPRTTNSDPSKADTTFAHPENLLNPEHAVGTAAQRVFDLPELVLVLVDHVVMAGRALDLDDDDDFDDFEELPVGAGVSIEAVRHAYNRRWQVNVFVENCNSSNIPNSSFNTPVLEASRMYEVRFLFEVNLTSGGNAGNDYDFSWSDFNNVDTHFPNLKSAQFILQFDSISDHVVQFCRQSRDNRTYTRQFLTDIVDGVRSGYAGLSERLIAVADATPGRIQLGRDRRNTSSVTLARMLLRDLAQMAYV